MCFPWTSTASTGKRWEANMRSLSLVLAALLAMSLAAAQDDDSGQAGMRSQADGMGGEMLGGNAETLELAAKELGDLPQQPLSWTVFDFAGITIENVITNPAPAFLYAHQNSHVFTVAGEERTLEEGQAIFLEQGTELGLAGAEGLWYSLLAPPDLQDPGGIEGAEVLARSGVLNGLPQAPALLSFVMVQLPMDGSTAVHSHPGPELIYVTHGELEYQTGMADTETLAVGDNRALPAGVAVQKRNMMGEMAAFLAWFVVDSEQPFAAEAAFE
jgi:hypothetical protein